MSGMNIWLEYLESMQCLTQVDDEEKASQIPLMHLIYQRATSVIVWLGPSSLDSTLADEYVRTARVG